MKYLVTGVGGFIGSSIARALLSFGNVEVIGVDDFSSGYHENVPNGCQLIECDLADAKQLIKLPAQCDYVMHLAGQSSGEISFDDPVQDLEKNTISTLNLIQYSLKAQVKKIIYASSMSVYGNVPAQPILESTPCSPLSCYGAGKLAAEQYLKIYRRFLPYTIFRLFNVYGPGQDLLNLRQGMISIYLAYALQENKHIVVKGSPNRFRDFVYIDDVAEIWLKSVDQRFDNQTFNLGTGCKTTVEELLIAIQTMIPGVTYEIKENTPGDQFGIYANNEALKQISGKQNFMSINEGLKKFYQHIQTLVCA